MSRCVQCVLNKMQIIQLMKLKQVVLFIVHVIVKTVGVSLTA